MANNRKGFARKQVSRFARACTAAGVSFCRSIGASSIRFQGVKRGAGGFSMPPKAIKQSRAYKHACRGVQKQAKARHAGSAFMHP